MNKHVKKYMRKTKFLLIKLLRIKDNAHSIALGFTVGFLINFVPSFGIGPILSTGTAKLVRGNYFAGLIGGLPVIWAFPLLFYLNVVVGDMIVPIENIEVDDGLESTDEVINVGLQVSKAFFVGMSINMIIFGITTYLLVYTIIKKFRNNLLLIINKKWTISRY